MSPLISVIVPIYKVEPYIRKCVDSILSQSYTNFEIILIDDNSPDNCGKICDEYAANNSTVKAIHKENGGLSDARNAGLDIATGEFICFVDSDDWCEREMLQVAYESIEKSKSDIVVYGAFYDYVQNGEKIRTAVKTSSREQKINSFDESLPLLIKNSLSVTAWTKLYRKKVFETLRFPKGKLFEDAWIFPKLFENCNNMFIISEPLYHYVIRVGGGSITSSFNPQILEAYKSWQVFEKNGNLSKIILVQNAWSLLIKTAENNEIHCDYVIKLLSENSQYAKNFPFYDRFFLFLILKKNNYKKVLFIRKKFRNFLLSALIKISFVF